MYCVKCGKELTEGRCENCGTAIENAEKMDTAAKDAIAYGYKPEDLKSSSSQSSPSEIGRDFRIFDYKTVEASQKKAVEIVDCYESLGWELAGKHDFVFAVSLNFRRNRKIKNKDQINRLQVRLDDHLNSIDVLEKRKTQNATIAALVIGIIGALIFGGGLCLCLLTPFSSIVSYTVGCVLGVVGAVICGLAYFANRKIRAKDTIAMNALIDKKRDEISQICEDAQRLLA